MNEETSTIDLSYKGKTYSGDGTQQNPVAAGGAAPEVVVSRLIKDKPFGYSILQANASIEIESYS